jgi:glycogen phosphorylase
VTIAYISPEIALPELVYSGGLGYLTHSYGLSAKSLGLDAVIVSILYRQSFDQVIENGKMRIDYTTQPYTKDRLEDTGIIFPLKINERDNFIKIWRFKGHSDMVPIYLLDTDIPENDKLGRLNTLQLYGGSVESGANLERWIAYALILGEGSVEALKRLNIEVSTYHLNESYLGFAAMKIADPSKTVFTTHTPVPSGNKKFDFNTAYKILGNRYTSEYLQELGCGDPFDMAAACIKLSRKVNAVSKRHLETIEKMWGWIENRPPFVAITNGVNKKYWQYPEFASAESPTDIAEAKKIYKRKLIDYIREQTGVYLSENVPNLVWARRIASYKRPTLLFFDKTWIAYR